MRWLRCVDRNEINWFGSVLNRGLAPLGLKRIEQQWVFSSFGPVIGDRQRWTDFTIWAIKQKSIKTIKVMIAMKLWAASMDGCHDSWLAAWAVKDTTFTSIGRKMIIAMADIFVAIFGTIFIKKINSSLEQGFQVSSSRRDLVTSSTVWMFDQPLWQDGSKRPKFGCYSTVNKLTQMVVPGFGTWK